MMDGELPLPCPGARVAGDHVREPAGKMPFRCPLGVNRGRYPVLMEGQAKLQPGNPAADDADVCHI